MNKIEYLCRKCPIDSSGLITVFDSFNRYVPHWTKCNQAELNAKTAKSIPIY